MPDVSPQTNGANTPKPIAAPSAPAPAVQPVLLAVPIQPAISLVPPANPAQNGNGSNGQSATNAGHPGTFKVANAAGQVRPSILQSLLLDKNLPAGGQQKTSAPSLSALLGPKPIFSRAAFEDTEKKREKFAKNIFAFAVILTLGIFGFFYSQLSANFTWFNEQLGPNPAQKFEASNNELKKIKTQLNLINFRTAKYWLDEANSYVDPFQRLAAVAKSDFSTKSEKQNAQMQVEILTESIKKSLSEVKNILNQPLGIDLYSTIPVSPEQREQEFEDLLKAELNKQKQTLSADPKLNGDELALFDGVIQFAESKKFRDTIRSQDLANISEEDFGKIVSRIREQATDELSAIEKIRKIRLDWAEVINNIHAVTRKADPYYGKGLFKTVGGFLFSSYNFDSKTGKITISGVTKTSDSKTFSFIAKLVDSIEKSQNFKNIDFRSFSKSRDETGDFSSSINLEFELQPADEADVRDDIASTSASAPASATPQPAVEPAVQPVSPATPTPAPTPAPAEAPNLANPSTENL